MTGPRIIGGKLTMSQRQWNIVFNFMLSMVLALVNSATLWWVEAPWWLTAIIIGATVHQWASREGNER